MSRKFVEEMQCDRCGHTETRKPNTPDDWTPLTVMTYEKHLCTDCKKEFDDWWSGKQ